MANWSGGIIAAVFILSLFLSTALVSYLALGWTGNNSIKVINLPEITLGYSNSHNFGKSCNLTSFDTTGVWSCSGSGLEIDSNGGELRVPLNLKSQSGYYDNTYHITSHSSDFTILVADTRYGNYIRVQVLPDQLNIPDINSAPGIGAVVVGSKWSTPIDGTLQDITIHTYYTPDDNTLLLDYNGQIFNLQGETFITGTSGKDMPYIDPPEIFCSEGILSSGSLTLESMTGDFTSADPEGLTGVMDGLAIAFNTAAGMLKLATYSFPYDIVPFTIQLWLIAPQEFMIGVGILVFFRSG